MQCSSCSSFRCCLFVCRWRFHPFFAAGYHAGWVSGMEEVYDKKTKSNHWVLTLTQACTLMVRTTKEKGRKIEGTRAQVYFGYLPARSV